MTVKLLHTLKVMITHEEAKQLRLLATERGITVGALVREKLRAPYNTNAVSWFLEPPVQ